MSAPSSLSRAWFAKADADFRTAQLVLAESDPLVDIACFHAQQCAEKYLKGYLITCGLQFRFVHDLAYLTRLCMEQTPDFSAVLDFALELQDYAVNIRYPAFDDEPVSIESAHRAIERAGFIREFVLQQI
jgi:HEPN domain-containing protein